MQGKVLGVLRLARVQYLLRVCARGAWLAGGIALTGNVLGFIDFETILPAMGIGAIAGLLTAIGRMTVKGSGRFAWRLDRQLGLAEQVSTAWEIEKPTTEVEQALLEEATETLRGVYSAQAERGWRLSGDFYSLVVVELLVVMAFINQFTDELPASGVAVLPLPGIASGSAQLPGAGQNEDGVPVISGGAIGELQQALTAMGERLQQDAPTADLGQVLEDGSAQAAAAALEELALRPESLSEDAQQSLEAAFREGAALLAAAELDEFRDSLEQAADTAANGNIPELQGRLLDVASELRALGQAALEGEGQQGLNDSGRVIGSAPVGGAEDFVIPSGEAGDLVILSSASLEGDLTIETGEANQVGLASDQRFPASYDTQVFSPSWRQLILDYFSQARGLP